jgi:hypothetical protein
LIISKPTGKGFLPFYVQNIMLKTMTPHPLISPMLRMVALNHKVKPYNLASYPAREASESSLLPLPTYDQPLFGIPEIFQEDLINLAFASNFQG